MITLPLNTLVRLVIKFWRKLVSVTAVLVLVSFAAAKDAPVYNQTAHVIGSQIGHRPSGAWACTYELRINNLTYVTIHNGANCEAAVNAGADLPAAVEKNKIRVLRNYFGIRG